MPKKNSRQFLTKERDQALYEEYQKVLTSFGETAPFIAKSELYRLTAEKFFISAESARMIISKYMRNKSRPENARI
jgi:endonuclease V-like protein UPF0215 family